MNYPEVLGRSISKMPPVTRHWDWFESLPSHIQKSFWHILEKFNPLVAAEYLRDNYPRERKAAVKLPARKFSDIASDHLRDRENVKLSRVCICESFHEPLAVSGTVLGELWPHSVSIRLPSSTQQYAYTRFTPDWAYVSVAVHLINGDRITRVSCSQKVACSKIRSIARGLVECGSKPDDIELRLYQLKLERMNVLGHVR